MRVVFADTGYWVALLNPHDDLHNKAINHLEPRRMEFAATQAKSTSVD